MLNATPRHVAVLFSLLSFVGCHVNPLAPGSAAYFKAQIAQVTGPSEVAVGQTVPIVVKIVYPDGFGGILGPGSYGLTVTLSDPAIGALIPVLSAGPGISGYWNLLGLAPGEVTFTAYPMADHSLGFGTLTVRVVK